MEPRVSAVRYLLGGGFYSMAVAEWGDVAAPPVICVHGLTRNGRDFDVLAEALADRYRVICPDLPGRGASDWLADAALYQPASYVVALGHLLAAVGGRPAFVGTSLGGICGMLLAAASGTPLRCLVLNDIGPFVPQAALARIRDYLGGEVLRFPDLAALERYLRGVHAPFGPLTDSQWAHLARHSARALPEGGFALHYDPAIAEPVRANEPADLDLSVVWDRIDMPMLAIRGAQSDLLLPQTFAAMEDRAALHEVAGAGHAPALMDAPTMGVISRFLAAQPAS